MGFKMCALWLCNACYRATVQTILRKASQMKYSTYLILNLIRIDSDNTAYALPPICIRQCSIRK